MRFRILGPFEVTDGHRVPELGGLKQRSVLAILLLAANRVVPLDRLIDQVWGGASAEGRGLPPGAHLQPPPAHDQVGGA